MNKKINISINSPVIITFSLLCFISIIIAMITRNASNYIFFSVSRGSLLNPLTYIRLFTHVIGHYNFNHFMGNIMLILVVGPLLEEKYGSYNILFIILATALITGIVHILLFPNYYLLGASGVVFAFILLSSFTSIKEGSIPITLILVALIYLGEQVYQALFVRSNISNLTHIIGGLVGAFLGYILNKDEIRSTY